MNYREKYKRHYNIAFGPEYEVHHIDLNHKNDDIENLVLLPTLLHHRYHFALDELHLQNGTLDVTIQIKSVMDRGNAYNMYLTSILGKYVDVYYECQEWMDYKRYLDGELPNIHNIYLGGAA